MKNSKKDSKNIMIELLKDVEMVFEGIGALLKRIWNFFTNPSILFDILKLKKLDSLYNRFLENEALTKLLALVAALALVFITRFTPGDFLQRPTTEIINHDLVVLQNPDHILIDSIIPDRIEVLLIGESNHVEMALRQNNIELFVDLRPLSTGLHTVHVQQRNPNTQVEIRTTPSTFTVNIAELEFLTHTVEPLIVNRQFINEDWVLAEPRLSLDEVQIWGADMVLANIATVQATIDINGIQDGATEFEAVLTAFDRNMNPLDVDIIPERLTAVIDVFRESAMIPFVYAVRGTLPPGLSISDIIFEPAEVEMFGKQEVLDAISEFVIPIEISQLNNNGEMLTLISPPDRIQYLRENEIMVRVNFQPTATRTFRNMNISLVNLGEGLTIETESGQDLRMDVLVRGAPRLLDQLTEADLDIFIDLSRVGEGEHTLPITMRVPEFLAGELDQSTRTIIINE